MHQSIRPICRISALLLTFTALFAIAARADEVDKPRTFRVERFQVEGNSLLPSDAIASVVAPFGGGARQLSDLYGAAEALQTLYREAGYPVVQVALPEQKLDDGVVQLRVIEGRFKEIQVNGNKEYSSEQIRTSLPSLKEGTSPQVRQLDRDIRQANENPGRRLAVNLQPGGALGEIKARVDVSDEKIERYLATLDNTGTRQTGFWRLGLGYQHANVAQRQHVFSFQYVTAPERLKDVQVLSAGYRIPLPAQASSLDLMMAYSNVKAGVTPTVVGSLFFAGEGAIFGIKLTRRLESLPEWEHKLSLGLDIKDFRNECALGVFGAAGCGEAGASIALHPVTVGYSGGLVQPAMQAQWNLSWSRNLPGGGRGGREDFITARALSNPHFSVLRAGASAQWPLMSQWMLRLGGQLQDTRDALVMAEQFGVGGAQSVRGYAERAASNDRGYSMNLEFYTPDLSNWLNVSNASLRGLLFLDSGTLFRNRRLATETGETAGTRLTSVGIGLRASLGKNWSIVSDLGHVMETTSGRAQGAQHVHFSLNGTF
ncbi:ShlB/FhaC/HecB family hemolysin secretion/activation protein [Denitratisoma oestradiolicum]|uniref:Hemolysin activation/secretion protein n=1 Tax=Denitratisoma oestradiolicum TaxID=311182 RepID=A0A6S6XXB4_9PROT|nr:ShlB/FhaC/HecB family hemolysin secretion/activation protein [Denitratisoma oestradiolicum]TWO79725.1 hypothetical protein CBW56_13355 [Denitratisoma oestradiolicum]CAB1367489.1 conserved exported protein of unknown function [Denitratisoma oestradiolicum]